MLRSHQGSAFTLVELLVALSIVGLLIALLLPAVQSAREASRRTQCASHLRQLGIAIHNYEEQWSCYPANSFVVSTHVRLLPWLGYAALANQYDPWDFADPYNSGASRLARHRIPVFQCPSDPHNANRPATLNYVGCLGTGHWDTESQQTGGILSPGFVRARDVTDGLSQTVAMSELLVGNGTSDRRRAVWRTPYALAAGDMAQFTHFCRDVTATADPDRDGTRGGNWTEFFSPETAYDHVMFPNDFSCFNGPQASMGANSAASEHPGGVHCMFGDGHLQFISTQVDLSVWRALGTRSGHEALTF